MRIPESKIEEIRSAADIVDVISEHVQLRKRGKNYLGLCPFHNEKTPSFTVSEDKQIFHCFGCHAGGNVFKFLMDYQKISFIEAVQELAAKLGIQIEVEEDLNDGKQSEQEILYEINSAAGRFFSDNLMNSIEGDFARSYFESRKIKLKTLREFGLGYAPANRDSFIQFAQAKKINLEKALYLGLIGRNNDGRLYDKFSGRIIFPIFSPNGRVVAFAGRILDKREGTAKYLNSPESEIYYKGRILYGLSHAKDEIRRLDKAILVEGYMDLISLYQSGIKNVVAVSGTALTDDQVQLLSRYTKNVVLIFDADTAGIKASMRSIEILLKKDIEIKIASLPSGEDPDSYVNNYGKEKFEDHIKQAQNFLEYQSAYFDSQGMFDDPSKMAEAIRELVKMVALISDELKRALLLKSIAQKFKLRINLIEDELLKLEKKSNKEIKRIQDKRLELDEQIAFHQNVVDSVHTLQYYGAEVDLIKLMFENDRSLNNFIFKEINCNEFEIVELRIIAELAYSSFQNNKSIVAGVIEDQLPSEQKRNELFEILIERNQISPRWEKYYPGTPREKVLYKQTLDTVFKFREYKIKEKSKQLLREMENVEDEERVKELLRTNDELNNVKKTLKDYLSISLSELVN